MHVGCCVGRIGRRPWLRWRFWLRWKCWPRWGFWLRRRGPAGQPRSGCRQQLRGDEQWFGGVIIWRRFNGPASTRLWRAADAAEQSLDGFASRRPEDPSAGWRQADARASGYVASSLEPYQRSPVNRALTPPPRAAASPGTAGVQPRGCRLWPFAQKNLSPSLVAEISPWGS
jgi:hypothetical protein